MNRIFAGCFSLELLLISLTGCGGAEGFRVAPVRGKVVSNGQVVSEGVVQFSPVGSADSKPGKTGAGSIEADGTFVVSTYKNADGAIVGACDVMAGSSDPNKPWPKELSRPIRYEVEARENLLVIEILPDGTGKITPSAN